MQTSIGKYSKSFLLKLLVAIIILPFLFWGMGDVFRGGNQNIVATIDSEKITAQNFINYLNRLNLDSQTRKNLNNTDLIEKILSDYIGKKIIELEIKNMGIKISDATLKNIVTNDKNFLKDEKFSRTKYELFLLQSSVTAVQFEANIVEQEKKRQLLSFLSAGITVPEFLIKKEFNKENQIKTIKYINLNDMYDKKKVDQAEIKKIYDENPDLFKEKFKIIKYSKITPLILNGKNEYDEIFFNKINQIENEILDGKSFSSITSSRNLNVVTTDEINKEQLNFKKIKSNKLKKEIFDRLFAINGENSTELINVDNDYYLAGIEKEIEKKIDLIDKRVTGVINEQLKIKDKLDGNREIIQKLTDRSFNLKKMKDYANGNGLEIKEVQIKNIKDNSIFKEPIIKKIFETKDNHINLITDSRLLDNFLVYTDKTEYLKLAKDSSNYEKYKTQAQLNFTRDIFNKYDKTLNTKYDIKINNKTLNRIKNSL